MIPVFRSHFLSGLLAALALLLPPATTALERNEVRQFVAEGNIDGMERAFAALQRAVRSNQIDVDTQLAAYFVFHGTDPRMEAFVEDWLRAHPDSVHAHVARTYWLMGSAFRVRSGHVGRFTYHEAHDQFRDKTRLARDHAVTAYELDPENAGAGNQILYTGTFTGLPRAYRLYLREIMDENPFYTLFRKALYSTAPAWGGSWERAAWMCDTFAHKIKDMRGYTAEVCRVDAAFLADHRDPAGQPDPEVFERSNSPALEKWRSRYAFFLGPGNRFGRDRAMDAARNGDINDLDLAREFDRYFPGPDSMFDIIYERRWAEAKRELEHDPYNTDYIDVLTLEGNGKGLLPNRPDHEELVALLRRAVVAHPYDGYRWSLLAEAMARRLDPNRPIEIDPYYINAMVYSNYGPGALSKYLFHREVLYLQVNPGHLAPIRERGDLARPTGTALGNMSPEKLICPLIRVYRLREAMCQRTGDEGYCRSGGKNRQIYQSAESQAAAQGICKEERSAGFAALSYKPFPRLADRTQQDHSAK